MTVVYLPFRPGAEGAGEQNGGHMTAPTASAPSRTLDELVIRYVGDRLRRGDITKDTARNIRNHLMLFARSFGNRPLDQLGPRAVERWLEEMTVDGTAKSTQALRMSSLRVFARWCVLGGHVTKDWTLAAPKVRRPRQMPRDMDNDHAAAVLAQARDERERLMVWLMFGCGLRCVEVSRLNVDDFDRRAGLLFIVGKGLHEREVPVTGAVVAAIDAYLATETHSTGPLIRTHTEDKRRVGPGRISGIMRRLVSAAGIKVRNYDGRSAHGLRAAAASDLYDQCQDPQVVQEFLGHANLATTSVYLRRRGVERVRDAQQRRRTAA